MVFFVQEHISNYLGALVQCAVGAVHAGPEGIYLSLKEATEAPAYLSASRPEGMVLYKKVKNLLQGCEYPLELEYQLLNTSTSSKGDTGVNIYARYCHKMKL